MRSENLERKEEKEQKVQRSLQKNRQQQSSQNLTYRQGNTNKDLHQDMRQGQLESYLSIRQVESKQITQFNLKICHTMQNQNQNLYHKLPQNNPQIIYNFYQTIKQIALFQKIIPLRDVRDNDSSQNNFKNFTKLTISIENIVNQVKNFKEFQKAQMNLQDKKYQESVKLIHLPLSHCPSKISHIQNVFSIEEELQSTSRQSISLFSRMMKPIPLEENRKQTQKWHEKEKNKFKGFQNQNEKYEQTNEILELQKCYLILKELTENILYFQGQFQQHQYIKQFLSFILKIKIIQITEGSLKQLQLISLTERQLTLFKESLLLYTFIVKQAIIMIKKFLLLKQIEQINDDPSFKSKSTNLNSLPSFNSKSIFSFPSNQFKSKIFSQIQIPNQQSFVSLKVEEDVYAIQQLLREKIQQNQTKFNKKKNCSLTYQTQNFHLSKIQLSEFHNLFYNCWLIKYMNQKIQIEESHIFHDQISQKLIFRSVYELLPTQFQAILFLCYVLKELEFNLLQNLKSQQQKVKKSYNHFQNQQISAKSSLIYQNQKNIQNLTNSNGHFKKSPSSNLQNDKQDKTKRINTKGDNSNKQQLKETRNLYERESIQDNQQETRRQNFLKNKQKDQFLHQKNKNSTSKLTLSRIYQSKLNNLMKKTQEINQKAIKTQLNLNKTEKQKKSLKENKNQSLVNLKSKQTLMRSKNPIDHQYHLLILQLKQKLNLKEIQLQEKQKIIKNLIFKQQINQIDANVNKKNIETICSHKIKNITHSYRQKLKFKKQQIKNVRLDLQNKNSYVQKVIRQREIEAKLFQQSNQLYNLKKLLLSDKQKQMKKKIQSQSLASLRKGCFKQVYACKDKQNIQELSNITQKNQSFSVLKISPEKQLRNKLQLKTQRQHKQSILEKLKKLQKKVNREKKTQAIKFFQ